MGLQAKTKNKIKRDAAKHARKQAKQTQYQKWAEQGKNTKSKRFMQGNKKGKTISLVSHPNGECGNPACQKCFDVKFRPFLTKKGPKDMPQWMWLRYREENGR